VHNDYNHWCKNQRISPNLPNSSKTYPTQKSMENPEKYPTPKISKNFKKLKSCKEAPSEKIRKQSIVKIGKY
jgi:hypothetical protein